MKIYSNPINNNDFKHDKVKNKKLQKYLEGSEGQVEDNFINFSNGLAEEDHIVDPKERDEQ